MIVVRCICPQYRSGICRDSGCDGHIPHLVEAGYDNESCEQLYNGFCTLNGIEHFKGLRAETSPSHEKEDKAPIRVELAGTSGKTIAEAVHAKPAERDFFSDKNLRLLFEVGVNTPANWRKGKSPPEGFSDAFMKKDAEAMRKCAERYKANRAKGDAMNSKHIKRGISDEQIYRESL